ncbi:MAG: class I SAM-dependent methyltransferase [Eubacteriaceae bacterium]|nr:class I SAM-dependent methyltransferase [Eubacteriaceae bacterium]
MRLDSRLSLAASLIEPCNKIADIGTDHGYLPIFMISTGKAKRAVATDAKANPLGRARANAEAFGMSSSIDFRLGFGLEPISEGECEAAFICGMGGDTINSIIMRSLPIAKSFAELVLQPQSHIFKVRHILDSQGFSIMSHYAFERGKFYEAIKATPGLRIQMPFNGDSKEIAYVYPVDPCLRNDLVYKDYLDYHLAARLQIQAAILGRASKGEGRDKAFEDNACHITAIKERLCLYGSQ